MRCKYVISTLLMAMLAVGGVRGAQALETPETVAQAADVAWLDMVDAGRYDESWRAASASFQAGVSEQRWKDAAGAARDPLGQLKTRKLASATYTKTLPGAPDGEYVVCVYAATFEHKASAQETVISTLEKDGTWRVAGYFVK